MLTVGPNLELLDNGEYGEGTYAESTRMYRALDLLVQPRVKSKDIADPPATPAEGDAYIIAATATGAWAGKEGQVARWTARSAVVTPTWEFFTPKQGWMFGVDDLNAHYRFNGTDWEVFNSGGGGGSYVLPKASATVLGGIKVGANLAIDANGVLSATSAIPGPAGANGADGLSAYQIAVNNGFVGTQAQWLASLQGASGTDGADGQDGATWRNGSADPDNAVGADGDYYLNTASGDVFHRVTGAYQNVGNIRGPQGIQGVKGDTGDTGPQGPAGTGVTILGTLTDPSELPGTGSPGDAYLISGNLWVWAGSVWTNVGNIQGPQGPTGATGATGAPGSVWRDGSGVPSNALGIDGDYYLNTANGYVYHRVTGTYTLVANIKGPQGNAGATGAPGSVWRVAAGAPSNSLGVDGDYYLNSTNSDVYLRAAGAYSVVANIRGLQGATGATGATGAAGTNGSVWRNGSGAPSNAVGVDGDYYLSTANGDVYQKASGTYGVIANLVGPQGAKGDTGDTGATGATGANGLSAYQIAVNNGFVGTEAQWLASLVGPQGPVGSNAWADITGKPSTFTPSAHSHAISDVTGLQTALDGKQAADPDTAKTDVTQSWTAQQTPMKGTLTDAATIDWNGNTQGQSVKVTTTAARTFGAPTNIVEDNYYVLRLTTGGFTPAWNTAFKWPSGGAPASLASGTYVFTFIGGPSNTLIPTGPGYLTGA